MYHGRGKKQVVQGGKEMSPQLYFGGRTPPAIKLLPNVNKAGSCRRYEIREVTPESGKSKSPSGESPPRTRKRPLGYASAANRRRYKNRLLRSLWLPLQGNAPSATPRRQIVADIRIESCAFDGQLLKKAFTNPDFLFIIKE